METKFAERPDMPPDIYSMATTNWLHDRRAHMQSIPVVRITFGVLCSSTPAKGMIGTTASM